MNYLQRICDISLRDHVPNVDSLNRYNTLSVESEVQGKRLTWLGHVFRMPNNRMPTLFGSVKEMRKTYVKHRFHLTNGFSIVGCNTAIGRAGRQGVWLWVAATVQQCQDPLQECQSCHTWVPD